MSTGATIDFAAIEAEVNGLSTEQIKEQLLKLKTQQLKTRAYYNAETAKNWRQKKAAEFKALVAKAKELGIHDEVVEQAKVAVSQAQGENEATSDEG